MVDRLDASAEKLLLANRRSLGNFQFTIPSAHEYRHQWLWDSCFTAIVLRHFDIDAAEKELLSLVSAQQNNGRIPHESHYSFLGLQVPYVSRITQPPFIARAALDVYKQGKSRKFLETIFPQLQFYHHWLELEREADGVFKCVNPNESGEDNAISWDSYLPLPIHRAMGFASAYVPFPGLPHLKHVNMTCIYADALESMAEISRILGKGRLQHFYSYKHEVVSRSASRLFMQDDRHFYDLTSSNKIIRSRTHSIFSPLYAGLLSEKDAKRLVNSHLLNKEEFWTEFPIPTVAIDEPKFNPKGYWRGPTWININWMIYRGLKRYGMKHAASELLEKTTALIKKSGFCEYYNPLTGKNLGAKDFTWSTLIIDMMKD